MAQARDWLLGCGVVLSVVAPAIEVPATRRVEVTRAMTIEPRREPPAPAQRDARRRWALGRMDEMARERLRCPERFKTPRQVAECEAEYARRYREYNELYLELSRDP